MTWAELRNARIMQRGTLGWYVQCKYHGIDCMMGAPNAPYCPYCETALRHNFEIREELRREIGEWAAQLGWEYDEPAGDIPLAGVRGLPTTATRPEPPN